MTREGFQKLEQELRDMRGPQLREHIQNLADARDKGDLSENAEYDVAKTALDGINKRINKLSQTLTNAEILEGIVDNGTVQMLTWVKFKNTKSGFFAKRVSAPAKHKNTKGHPASGEDTAEHSTFFMTIQNKRTSRILIYSVF